MSNERAMIARLEAANTEELAALLARPTAEQEQALRVYLGNERYQRMHSLALKRTVDRGTRGYLGNVVVIPGMMGSELSSINHAGIQEQIWVKILQIVGGGIARLRLDADGRSDHNRAFDVRATGILKRHYGELLLSLATHYNVRAFWFDWRKDLAIAADELRAQISGWFPNDAPVSIVAHSLGGLVARSFIKNHPDRWNAMRQGDLGGRLIMLGTPNHGSFAVPQIITGREKLIRYLELADVWHTLPELLSIVHSFVGTYQMLPSPLVLPRVEPLYDAKTYRALAVPLEIPQRHLDNARKLHMLLHDVIDPERMIYIAGHNQPTFSDVQDFRQLDNIEQYELTLDGDGRVPHNLGLLKGVKTYYVEENHGSLSTNQKVLAALDELLATGTTGGLSAERPQRRDAGTDQAELKEHLRVWEDESAADEQRFRISVERMRARSTRTTLRLAGRGQPTNGPAPVNGLPAPADSYAAETGYVSFDERIAEEILTRGLLSYSGEKRLVVGRRDSVFDPPTITIGLLNGGINDPTIGGDAPDALTVDALSVGHYLGVKPQAAELALDEAISRQLRGKVTDQAALDNGKEQLLEADLLLTQYTERGIIRGELGQPFFMSDPRPVVNATGQPIDRVIAIAGMGLPGRFGAPELTVLVRELCWALGRLGKHHLASVLIGSGNGNLPVREAVAAWLQGIQLAMSGSADDSKRQLSRITFVELDPRKMEIIDRALIEEQLRLRQERRLLVEYTPLSEAALKHYREQGRQKALAEWEAQYTQTPPAREPAATRISVALDGRTYRFGAITATASIPERSISLDPALVRTANEELAAERNLMRQVERGRFMERLLIPGDLRAELYTGAPLVMLLDATTARIHWEVMAQFELTPSFQAQAHSIPHHTDDEYFLNYFFGTARGFTRQLRTLFASPPEPPPPPRRLLRVLVVADPAEDAHLPGAEEEGVEVADLFESFNTVHGLQTNNRVEVVRLFGPREATRTNVLRELLLRPYDVLHFAGHCVFDPVDPSASGWIFTKGERLTAHELNRIDRVPKFIFSNACESGITPDRAEQRSVDLAPSFAEAIFGRGVSNFVCTAWPVDDVAARQFALTLYAVLLGLPRPSVGAVSTSWDSMVGIIGGANDRGANRRDPEPMYAAMREARRAIAKTPNGLRTWGAYQHYGNPFLRFFDKATMYLSTPPPPQPTTDGAATIDRGHAKQHGTGS